MGLITIFFILFCLILLSMIILPVRMTRRFGKGPKPYKISWAILIFLLGNWLLLITGFYSLIPENVAELIFIPVWLVLGALGMIISFLEFRNNKAFAIPLAGLTMISLFFALLLKGISQM